MKVGYARVSTRRQRLDLQYRALEEAGCDVIVAEKSSGGSRMRSGLISTLALCRRDDVLVVWKIDRLGRNPFELIEVMRVLNASGAGLQVLTGPASLIDIASAEGRSLFAIYAAIAGLETGQRKERASAGLAAARARKPRTEKEQRRKLRVRRSALRSTFTACVAPTAIK